MAKATTENHISSGRYTTLAGGSGNDIYQVWHSNVKIKEGWNEGIDTMYARFWGDAYLPGNVENLILANKGSTLGFGNRLDNIIQAGTTGATLNGLRGNDLLIGGAGADVFEFYAGYGSDTVRNFTSGVDSIRLKDYGVESFDELLTLASQSGSDTILDFGRETLTLENVDLGNLTGADFGFRAPTQDVPDGYQRVDAAGRGWNANGWYVINNTWGSSHLKEGEDFSVDVVFSQGDMTSGTAFNWSYPYITDAYKPILAYPEVAFGVSPMGAHEKNPTDTANVFPIKIADLTGLSADHDVSFGGTTSGFNVAYDIWFTSVPNGGRSTMTNEVMIWVHEGDFPPSGSLVGTYSQDGLTAEIYHKGTYTAVVFDQDVPKAEMDLLAIFEKLEELDILSSEEYLASIELGAEVVSGVGSLTINNLDFTVETRAEDGGTITKEVTGAGTTVTETPPIATDKVFEIVNDGVLIGFKSVEEDGNVCNTEWCDDKGKLVRSQVEITDNGKTTVMSYDAARQMTGMVETVAMSNGNISTRHYDADMTFTGAENTAQLNDGTISVRYYDENWQFTGMANTVDEGNGTTSTRFYDENSQFTGADNVVQTGNGVTSTRHFDANWEFTGAENVSVRANGERTLYYDENWSFSGAQIVRQEGPATVELTYDANWGLTSRTVTGSDSSDTIDGHWSAESIHGGLGSDIITGGSGSDSFHFDTAIGNGDVDTILDFRKGADTIVLDQEIFSEIKDLGQLDSSAFVNGTQAHDADDRIIYDEANGDLYYDPDGSGDADAILFAHVESNRPLHAADFEVIA